MENAKILVIDDEKVICEGCRLVLEDHGCQVTYRTTGQDGLNELAATEFDVLLLDLKLPDMDGMEILTTVRQSYAGLPVIIMTGYATIQNQARPRQWCALGETYRTASTRSVLDAAKWHRWRSLAVHASAAKHVPESNSRGV